MKKAVILFLILFLFTTSLVAQEQTVENQMKQDYLEGMRDGEEIATGNFIWFFAGFLFPYGNIAAYLIKPNPPASAFIGKSAEYIQGFSKGYSEKSRNKNVRYSLIGTGTLIVTGVVIIIIAADDIGDNISDACSPNINCNGSSEAIYLLKMIQ